MQNKKVSKNKIFLPCHSSLKWSNPGNFLESHPSKECKKRYMEMTKKIDLETLKIVLGCSILHYSPWSRKRLVVESLVAKLCLSYQLIILTLQYICRHRYYLWKQHLIETPLLNSQIPHLHFDLTLGNWKTLCKKLHLWKQLITVCSETLLTQI